MAARITAYVVVAIVSATLIAGLIVGAQRDDNDGPVDLIVRNGTVYTADRRGTIAEAVAIRGNQILKVGSDREIARLERPQTVIVDARGGAVLPGFNDSHVDLLEGGLALSSVDLTHAENVSDVLERITAWGAANPSAAWIVGRGWSPELFRNVPGRQLLDSVAPARPVVVFGGDESTPSVWVNSHALRMAGITRKTPDPERGTIVREPRTREPSGVLTGEAARLVSDAIVPPADEQRVAALRAAIATAHSLGVTSVQSGVSREELASYDALRRAGELAVRVSAALRVEPHAPADIEAKLSEYDRIRSSYPDDPLFKSGALIVQLDGDVATRTAALLEPYEGSTRAGDTLFAPDHLNRLVRLADAAGWQVVTRATGDRAVRMALYAYAHAIRSNRHPERGRRHRIEGLGLVDASDVGRFGPLGVIASMQPRRATPSAARLDLLEKALGAGRAAQTFRLRTIAEETRMTFGSGWPTHAFNPMLGLHVAVNQMTAEGSLRGAWRPAERMDLQDAVDAYTSGPAWASFDEQRKGSLSPGMLADLVVLSDDIFAAPPARLAATSVAVTVFDGKVVYQRTPHAETEPPASLQH